MKTLALWASASLMPVPLSAAKKKKKKLCPFTSGKQLQAGFQGVLLLDRMSHRAILLPEIMSLICHIQCLQLPSPSSTLKALLPVGVTVNNYIFRSQSAFSILQLVFEMFLLHSC